MPNEVTWKYNTKPGPVEVCVSNDVQAADFSSHSSTGSKIVKDG